MKVPQVFIGVIPARKGSKGLINKNILKIKNKTLLEISVENALQCSELSKVVVSTDYEIQETGLNRFKDNEKFIFLPRSSANSQDNSSTEGVIKEIFRQVDFVIDSDCTHVVLLQPTSPLRKNIHISKAVDKYLRLGMQKLASFVKVEDHHPDRMYRISDDNATSYNFGSSVSATRQSLEELYLRNGAIYICNLNAIMHDEKFAAEKLVPFLMNSNESINIDSELDFKLAKYLMCDESPSFRAK